MWLTAFGVPYPLLLGIFVGLLDLVPVVGSTIAGVVVAAVALTVSPPVCIATIVFFVAFRLGEDYLLMPKVIGRAVKVPALTTVVAVIGGASFGIVNSCRIRLRVYERSRTRRSGSLTKSTLLAFSMLSILIQ